MTPAEETLFRKACSRAFEESDTVLAVFHVPIPGLEDLALAPFTVVQFASGQCGIIVPSDWEKDTEIRFRVDAILQQEGSRAAGAAPN